MRSDHPIAHVPVRIKRLSPHAVLPKYQSPDAAAMEDFELVRRLRGLGRIAIAEAAVSTSARRWLEHGVGRTTMLNQLCIGAYLAGVSPDRIARWRREAARTTRFVRRQCHRFSIASS